MLARPDVPADVLAKLRAICLGLPEAYEEIAWAGTRWCVRKKNFAHVLMLDAGWPPAYAQAAQRAGPATLLTFRVPAPMLDAPKLRREPFFKPVWFVDIVGMIVDASVDWDDVEHLLSESYGVLAPKKLAALVEGLQ